MNTNKLSIPKGMLYILLTTLIFSTMEVAQKMVAEDFSPTQITMLRFLIGGILLLPFVIRSLKKKHVHLKMADLRHFVILGLFCVVVSMSFYQLSVERMPASVVSVIFSGNPVVVSVTACLILRQPLTKTNISALLFDILGILIIVNPFDTKLDPLGVVFLLIAILTFSLYAVMGKKYVGPFGSLTVTGLSLLIGALEMLLLLLIGHIPPLATLFSGIGLSLFANVPLFSGIHADNLAAFLWISVVVSAAGYYFYMKAIEETSPHEASLVFFFKPVLAPLLAMWLLQEQITLNMVIAICCFLIGALFDILPGLLHHRRKGKYTVLR